MSDWEPPVRPKSAVDYPLVQMDDLARVIHESDDVKKRKLHAVFLQVFDKARWSFIDFLESLDGAYSHTPTMAYRIDEKGSIMPVAAEVIEIHEEQPENSEISGTPTDVTAMNGVHSDMELWGVSCEFHEGDFSPVFALTRIKVDAPQSSTFTSMDDAFRYLAEMKDILEEAEKDEPARVLPPVVMKDTLNGSENVRYVTPTPSPVFPLVIKIGDVHNHVTPVHDTRVMAYDMTPTPRQEAPKWLWRLFAGGAGQNGPLELDLSELDRIVAEEKEKNGKKKRA